MNLFLIERAKPPKFDLFRLFGGRLTPVLPTIRVFLTFLNFKIDGHILLTGREEKMMLRDLSDRFLFSHDQGDIEAAII